MSVVNGTINPFSPKENLHMLMRNLPKITRAFKIENLQVSACQIQDVGWLPCTSWPGKCTMWNLFFIHHALLGLVFNLEWGGLKILSSSREESWLECMCFSSSTECGERQLQGVMHKIRSFSECSWACKSNPAGWEVVKVAEFIFPGDMLIWGED